MAFNARMVYFWMIWGTPILGHHHIKIEYPNYWMANTENTFKPVVPRSLVLIQDQIMFPTSSTSNASGGKLYELKTFGSHIVGWQSPWFGGIMDDFVLTQKSLSTGKFYIKHD